MTDKSENVHQNVSQNVSQKPIYTERQRRIIAIINADNQTSVDRIASILDVTPRTIYRDIKAMGLRWVGPSKTGRWEIQIN